MEVTALNLKTLLLLTILTVSVDIDVLYVLDVLDIIFSVCGIFVFVQFVRKIFHNK